MKTGAYWQFSEKLPKFPSLSSDLEVDVVIIGAGLTGITAAWLLKREGAKVALLDRQRCAGGDTGLTTAHLTYVTDERLRTLVKHFGKDAARAFWEAGAAAIDQIYEIVKSTGANAEFIEKNHSQQGSSWVIVGFRTRRLRRLFSWSNSFDLSVAADISLRISGRIEVLTMRGSNFFRDDPHSPAPWPGRQSSPSSRPPEN